MFHYNNFFDLGPFLTFHSNVMDQKMAGAKKVVKTKNQFFHACQLRKGIFEIHSHRCCILRTCFQIFYWLPLFQELNFSAKNQLVQCFSTCRIRISGVLLYMRAQACINPIPLTSFNDENAKCHNFDNFDPNKCANDFQLELFKIFQGKKNFENRTIGSRVMGRRNKQGGLSGPPPKWNRLNQFGA